MELDNIKLEINSPLDTILTLQEVFLKYDNLEIGVHSKDKFITISGRIINKKIIGENLFFYDLVSDNYTIQIMSDLKSYKNKSDFYKINSETTFGDFLKVKGSMYKTNTGILTLVANSINLITKCKLDSTSMDENKLHITLFKNKELRNFYYHQNNLIMTIRNYLNKNKFMEVHDNKSDKNTNTLFEFMLGGFNRIYNLINEENSNRFQIMIQGVEYYHLINIIEDLIFNLYSNIKSTEDYDFELPFKQIDLLDTIENKVRKKYNDEKFVLPSPNDSNAFDVYSDIHDKYQLIRPFEETTDSLLNNIIDNILINDIYHPTFILNYPKIFSNACEHSMDKNRCMEFSLYINKMKVSNGRILKLSGSVPFRNLLKEADDFGIPKFANVSINMNILSKILFYF